MGKEGGRLRTSQVRAGARVYHRRKVTGVAQRRRGKKSWRYDRHSARSKGFPRKSTFCPPGCLVFFPFSVLVTESLKRVVSGGFFLPFLLLPSSLSGDLNLGHLSLNACTSFLRPLFYPTCHSTLACTEGGGTNLRISLLAPPPPSSRVTLRQLPTPSTVRYTVQQFARKKKIICRARE